MKEGTKDTFFHKFQLEFKKIQHFCVGVFLCYVAEVAKPDINYLRKKTSENQSVPILETILLN